MVNFMDLFKRIFQASTPQEITYGTIDAYLKDSKGTEKDWYSPEMHTVVLLAYHSMILNGLARQNQGIVEPRHVLNHYNRAKGIQTQETLIHAELEKITQYLNNIAKTYTRK
jgi:hypothetical protein